MERRSKERDPLEVSLPTGLTVLKLGGELLEPGQTLPTVIASIARLAARTQVIVVHGAGREIDADMQRRGVQKVAIEGLRVTDAETLESVIAVLAGTVNTRLVAALVKTGMRAVGLTGADAALGLCARVPPHRTVDGSIFDLGFVGQPLVDRMPDLIADLLARHYVPVIATLGLDTNGDLLNVNADTMAAALAGACGAERLLIAGATTGVLDSTGATLPILDEAGVKRLIESRGASAGMVAKLRACCDALHAGVKDVRILSGRHQGGFDSAPGTQIVSDVLNPALS